MSTRALATLGLSLLAIHTGLVYFLLYTGWLLALKASLFWAVFLAGALILHYLVQREKKKETPKNIRKIKLFFFALGGIFALLVLGTALMNYHYFYRESILFYDKKIGVSPLEGLNYCAWAKRTGFWSQYRYLPVNGQIKPFGTAATIRQFEETRSRSEVGLMKLRVLLIAVDTSLAESVNCSNFNW